MYVCMYVCMRPVIQPLYAILRPTLKLLQYLNRLAAY